MYNDRERYGWGLFSNPAGCVVLRRLEPYCRPCAKDGSTLGGIMKAYDEIRKTILSESSGFVAGVLPSVLLLLSLCFATLVMQICDMRCRVVGMHMLRTSSDVVRGDLLV